MNVSLVGRLYRRIQKKIFSLPTLKTAVLSFALFATFFSSVMPAFAQDATYKNYRELFKGNSSFNNIPATTDLLDTTAKKQIGLRFNFNYSFEGKTNPTSGQAQDIEWFWDHVSNNENDGFLVRVCETDTSGAINEASCKITSAPYKTHPPGGFWNVIADILIPSNASSATGLSNLQEKKANWIKLQKAVIFKNGYINASDNDTYPVQSQQIIFVIKKLSTLNANGSENESAISYDLKGQTLKAELWYCGGEPSISGNTDPKPYTAHTTDTTAKQFGNRCSGRSYFKIGETQVPIQTSFINAQQAAQNAPQVTLQDPLVYNPDPLPSCDVSLFNMNFMGCIARAVYYVVYWPMATLAGLLGNVFDFFLGYSIADQSYRADFVVRGWKLVRDISNIFFILILVYTGFMAVFNTASISMKKVVPNLIINALIINFSLFATHVVIDISNITARIFYNVMPVCKGECEKDANGNITNQNRSASGYWPLSEKIVSSFNPQKIFSSSVLNNNAGGGSTATSGVGSTAINQTIQTSSKLNTSSSDYAGYFIVVSLIAGAVMFGTAMMFWKTAFFFLGRVVGLYVTMIFAPFAFLTRGGMPLVGNIAGLKWNDWVSELIKYALLAPIFVFFLYIIYAFLNSNFLELSVQDIDTTNFFGSVIKIVIPMLLIYFLIKYGVDLAKTYAGKVGTMVQQQTTKWAGYAGGAALGAVGVVGSRVVGGAAAIIDESRVGRKLRDAQVNGNLLSKPFAKFMQKRINSARTGSFDARQTMLGKSLFKEMEVTTDHAYMDTLKYVGLPGLSVKERAGGFDAAVEKRKKAQLEDEKLLKEKMPDDKIKKMNKKEKDKYTEKVDKIIEDKLITILGSLAAVTALKTNDKAAYDDMKIEALKDANVQAQIKNVPEPKVMKSASEVDAERRKQYAENLQKGGMLDQILNVPIVGDLTGATVRRRGDKKAAKDIEDKSKVEKELGEIEETLKKGFQDLIAVEMFHASPSFTLLPGPDRADLLKDGVISSGTNKGKRMYDILNDNEKAAVDARRKILNKDEEEEYLNLSLAQQQTKFDMKAVNAEVKTAKQTWQSFGTPAAFKAYKEKLREKWQAEKQNKIYRNFAEYVKNQKDKLKDKEPDK